MMRTYRRRASGAEKTGWWTATFVIIAAAVAAETYVLMLLLGAAHLQVAAGVPPLGFWATLIVIALLNFVSAYFKGK